MKSNTHHREQVVKHDQFYEYYAPYILMYSRRQAVQSSFHMLGLMTRIVKVRSKTESRNAFTLILKY